MLNEKGVPYTFVDITSGMAPLKRFLKLRDNRPEFDPVKERGAVGLPCFVIDKEEIAFELPEDLDEFLPDSDTDSQDETTE